MNKATKIVSAIGAAAIIAAGGGVAWGAAVTSHDNQVASNLRSELARVRAEVNTWKQRAATARAQAATASHEAATARHDAAMANAKAQAKAKSHYAAKEAKVTAMLRTLRREQAVVKHNTISADGVYVVGQDIAPGIYHTSGNGGGILNQCYYALLSSDNTSDIIDNNNFNGPETVDVSGAHAFEINGGCTWTKIG